MRAFIFAAGLGTRLKPFTEHHPKALVPIGGVPMLQRVIEKLKAAGVTDFVVNVHHFADQITNFLSANSNFGVNIAISDETGLLRDTGGALLHARHLFPGNEPILIHNADILTDFDVNDMASKHMIHKADVTLLCDKRESSRQLFFDSDTHQLRGWKNLKTGETIPQNFDEIEQTCTPLAFGGVHLINPPILQAIANYSTDEAFPIIPFYLSIINTHTVIYHTPETRYTWFDIGKPETLAMAERSIINS